MNAPESVFIDARVAERLPAEPPETDAPTVQYMRMDIVQAMVQQAHGGAEFFIQVVPGDNELLGLSNYGRLYCKQYTDPGWKEMKTPDFD